MIPGLRRGPAPTPRRIGTRELLHDGRAQRRPGHEADRKNHGNNGKQPAALRRSE
jgi:hypothetical protein